MAMLLLALGPAAAQARMSAAGPVVSVEIVDGAQSEAALDIRRNLPPRLRAALAARTGMVPVRGGRVIVRITTIFLSSDFSGDGMRRSAGTAMQDGIDGEMLVVDARGHIVSRKPVSARSPVHAGGSWRNPDHEKRRIAALVDTLAYWIVRGLE